MTKKTLKKKSEPAKVIDRAERQAKFVAWLETEYSYLITNGKLNPLEIGMVKLLIANKPDRISGITIRRSLHRLTNCHSYRQKIINSSHRIKIDGSQGSEITPEQRELASE